jgi:hypothetical protein
MFSRQALLPAKGCYPVNRKMCLMLLAVVLQFNVNRPSYGQAESNSCYRAKVAYELYKRDMNNRVRRFNAKNTSLSLNPLLDSTFNELQIAVISDHGDVASFTITDPIELDKVRSLRQTEFCCIGPSTGRRTFIEIRFCRNPPDTWFDTLGRLFFIIDTDGSTIASVACLGCANPDGQIDFLPSDVLKHLVSRLISVGLSHNRYEKETIERGRLGLEKLK